MDKTLGYILRIAVELRRYIYEYIPITVKVYISKQNYIKYYNKAIYNTITNQITYGRRLISFDHAFSFSHFINHTLNILFKNRKITYKNKKYSTLYNLYDALCIQYQSTKCRNMLRYIHR
jgi:hypothetical protein